MPKFFVDFEFAGHIEVKAKNEEGLCGITFQ
jgi:hypothetical protein